MGKILLLRIRLCISLCTISLLCHAQPHAAFTASPLTGCAPLVVSFTDVSNSAVEWKWDLGNNTISYLKNPSVTYFMPGSYTVKLIVKNAAGLVDSLIKTNYITVNPLPVSAFTANNLSGCFPLPVNFTDNSTSGTITNRVWDFGDGNTSTVQNPHHVYVGPGLYNVSLKVTNNFGCLNTLTKLNYITTSTGVHAGFTYSAPTSCSVPQTINFTNTSTGTGILNYSWNFGDGTNSTLQNPSHTYTINGSYNVQLIVANATGCSDTLLMQNIINLGVNNPDFNLPATGCVKEAIKLTNLSTPVPNSVVWTFGDGTTSTQINPLKSFNAPGTYTVKMVAQLGPCKDSITKSITILAKPVANFTGTNLVACQPSLTANFTNSSIDAVSYAWQFGDGSTSNVENPSHTYTDFGNYTVTLIVTNTSGCTDTIVKKDFVKVQRTQISINNLPQMGCAPLPWTFGATVNSASPVVAYLWSFGDGSTSTAANPSHIFSAGIYDIQLIVTTAGGCTDTVTVVAGIKAAAKPHAGFYANPRNICAEMPVTFHDTSTIKITSWLWNFGDGGTSTDSMPSYMYSDTGYFNITLIVGSNGCFDTLVVPRYIHVKPPIALFSVPIECNNKFTRVFTDQSIGADEWHWSFGDGGTSTQKNPTHTYTSSGEYTIKLVVKNFETGCEYTKSTTLTIADEKALFSGPTEICRGLLSTFTATTIQPQSFVASYNWNFGDGGTATGKIVNHTYSVSGIYNVQLIITDVNGCSDTLKKPAYIKVFGPTADFKSSVPGTCISTAVTFTDLSVADATHPIKTWGWNYGDGNIANNATAPFTHNYANAGNYSIILFITDSYGCRDSVTKPNLITVSTPEAIFVTNDTVTCPNADVTFSNNSTGPGLTYKWNFGDGHVSTDSAPVHQYIADGRYTVSLLITDVYNCTSLVTKNNYIIVATPVAGFTVNDSVGTCPPLIVQFTNNSLNQKSLLWDFGDGNTSTAANPQHFYNIPGTYISKLTITSPGGCTSVKTKTIRVTGPIGSFQYVPNSGCAPIVINFMATTLARSSFIWDFNDGNTLATTDSIVSHSYTIPGVYLPKMILKDANGCIVPILGLDTIKVNGVQAAFSLDTTLHCDSGIVQFTDESQSNVLITKYSWDFGDGTTSDQKNPSHFYSTTGIYHPTLKVFTEGGCESMASALRPIKVVMSPKISASQSASGCTPLIMNFNGALLNSDTSAINWKWAFSDGSTLGGKASPPATFIVGGIYQYTLTATNSSGCKDVSTGNFEVFSKPNVVASPNFYICQNTGKPLQATGAVSYNWSPAEDLSCVNCASPIATPIKERKYKVTGTSEHGCKNSDSVMVSVVYPFNMLRGTADTLCAGGYAPLQATGAASYSWSPSVGLNTTTGSRVMARPAVTTLYKVIGKDGKNCFQDTAYYPVQVYPVPKVSIRSDTTINVGSTIVLTPRVSADVNSVVWQNPIGLVASNYPSITVRPTGQVQYTVEVRNEGGCTTRSSMNVFVTCNGSNVFIPNTFSPNADGANDVFYVRGTGLFNIKQMRIFNRWGEEVFAKTIINANDANAGWDGTYKGQKLNPDVYVYMVEVQCENTTTLVYKGNVTLIK